MDWSLGIVSIFSAFQFDHLYCIAGINLCDCL
jgi:hypothetical protein